MSHFRTMRILLLFVLVILSYAAVLDLNKNTYALARKTHKEMMVMYYAPWCTWSKRLLPLFTEAAKVLEGKVTFAKVDCSENTQIRDEEHIKAYPTVKFHIDDQVVIYDAPHDSATRLVQWVTSHFETDRHISTVEELEKFLGPRDIHSLAYFPAQQYLTLKPAYDRVSRHFDDILFGETSQTNVIQHLIKKYPELQEMLNNKNLNDDLWTSHSLIFVLTHHRESSDRYGLFIPDLETIEIGGSDDETDNNPMEDAEVARFHSFIQGLRTPSVMQFSRETMQKVFSDPRPLVILFDNKKMDELQHSIPYEAFTKAALIHREQYMFLLSGISTPYEKRLADLAAIEEIDLPAMRLLTLNPDGHANFYPALKYKGPTKESFRQNFLDVSTGTAVISAFLNDFEKGSITPYLKSEPIPEYNNGPVVDVVGLTFDKIVKLKTKDVFVVLYAPWCGHCKRLEQTYKQLAQFLSGVNTLTIARMDATRNEVADVSVQAFPTLRLYKAVPDSIKGVKDTPLDYDGARTVEAMAEFIAQHATYSFNHKNPPPPSEAAEAIGGGLLGDEL